MFYDKKILDNHLHQKYNFVVSNRGYGRRYWKREQDLKRITKLYDEGYTIVIVDMRKENK